MSAERAALLPLLTLLALLAPLTPLTPLMLRTSRTPQVDADKEALVDTLLGLWSLCLKHRDETMLIYELIVHHKVPVTCSAHWHPPTVAHHRDAPWPHLLLVRQHRLLAVTYV